MKLDELAAQAATAIAATFKKTLDPLRESVRDLVQRADKHGQQLDSLERRASRHAEHLAHLESRLQSIERKGNE